MQKEIVKFPIGDDGEFIMIEVDATPNQGDRLKNVSRLSNEVQHSIEVTKQTIESSLDSIGKLGNSIVTKVKSINSPDEIDIQFGLKLTAEVGLVIANASGETHLQISMKWKKR